MSHVATVDVRVTDLEAMKEACAALGLKFMEGQKSYRFYSSGWQDDSPVPDGLFETAEETARVRAMSKADRIKRMNEVLGKCDHAIRVPGAEYEIGLKSRADGSYSVTYDWYGSGGRAILTALGGEKAPKLVQEYANAKLKSEARRYGHIIESEERMADGSIKLRLLAGRY